jgi:hypothetical protein
LPWSTVPNKDSPLHDVLGRYATSGFIKSSVIIVRSLTALLA